MRELILASNSPRRRELLARLQMPYKSVSADVTEYIDEALPLCEAIEQVAWQKARAVETYYPKDIIISADTIVVLDNVVYGKPQDADDAMRMLRKLSGKTHEVITGVCLMEGKRSTRFHHVSKVTFYDISEEEIAAYVATKEPLDKAGAYGIQELGGLLVKNIDGDFCSIMGLPLAMLQRKLKEFMP